MIKNAEIMRIEIDKQPAEPAQVAKSEPTFPGPEYYFVLLQDGRIAPVQVGGLVEIATQEFGGKITDVSVSTVGP